MQGAKTAGTFAGLIVLVAVLAVSLALLMGGATAQAGAAGDGDRPHTHDRWVDPATGEAVDEIDLVERTVEVPLTSDRWSIPLNFCQQGDSDPGQLGVCIGQREVFPGRWASGDHKIVPPGTSHLEVTLEFSGDDFHEVAIFHTDGTTTQWQLLTDDRRGTFAPGGDTKTLSVSLEEADDGHARVSSWRFLLEARGTPAGPASTGPVAAQAGSGPIEVRITAHRGTGDLPLEPAHPDLWEDDDPPTDTYRVGRLDGTVDRYAQVGRAAAERRGDDGRWTLRSRGVMWEIPAGFEGRRIDDRGSYPHKLGGTHDLAMVPPGTRNLVARVTVDVQTPAGPAPEVCVLGQDIPGKRLQDLQRIGPCQTISDGETEILALRSLDPGDTDSYYTPTDEALSRSRWTFFVQVRPAEPAESMILEGEVHAEFFATQVETFPATG